MPNRPHKDDDSFDIDAVIDAAKLEELRKKYADADDDGTGSFVLPAEESDSAQPDTPVCDEEDVDTLDKQPLGGAPGETVVQDIPNHESETPSTESLEKLMSSFRTVYEEGEKPVASTGHRINASHPTSPSPIPEQEEAENLPKKKEAVRDYLAGMRIVYEEPEESFSTENKKTKTVTDLPFPVERTQQDTLVEPLFESAEPTGGLAELFEHAQEQPSVKESASKRFAKRIFPHKGDSIGESIRKTVLFIAVITMISCTTILLNIYVLAPYLSNRDSQKAIDIKTNSNITADWATAADKFPGIAFPTGMQLKHAEFYAINEDFIGWLEIPGTDINMPIVKGKDNTVYLKKTFYGEKSKYGCCFLDSNNNISALDRNTIIYGHNMSYDDLMFGPLENYKSIDGYKAAPIIHFGTLYKNTKWKVYAVFITNGEGSGDNGYLFNYIFRNLSNDDAFLSYIKQIDQRTLYATGVDILPTDKLLTLSTCVYDFKNSRLAVVARLLREGESEEVDVSQATPRKSPRYPQAWYTAKGQTNPYKSAEQWFPN